MVSWDWGLGAMIVTGAISGAVTLDADSDDSVQFAYDQGIPDDTPRFKTKRGMQFVFKRPPNIYIKTIAGFIDRVKLDMKGDGGVTAVPPAVPG
jgi:Bifunctional DNA primase/polymerase, N-terminal